jgi:glycosyltransferase involved in cell wall biosynthesis
MEKAGGVVDISNVEGLARQTDISVIVPAYNAETTLRRCVESALSQTHHDLEVIIVDDGSTDGTLGVASELASQDGRCRVISQENRGLSGARNAGLREAVGDFVFFLDADDSIEVDELKALLGVLRDSGADMVVGGFTYSYPDETVGKAVRAPFHVTDERGFWEEFEYDRCAGKDITEYIVSWGKLFRRELFAEERFDIGRIHEDEFIIHRLVGGCGKVAFADVCGYLYMQRDDSIVHSRTASTYCDATEAFLERADYFAKRGWWSLSFGALVQARGEAVAAQSLGLEQRDRERCAEVRKRLGCLLGKVSPKVSGQRAEKARCFIGIAVPGLYGLLRKVKRACLSRRS